MSEREMRKYAGHKTGCRGATYLSLTRGEPICSCGYEEVSCQPPDLVVLLRDANAKGSTDPIWSVVFDELCDYVLDKFGLQLTDDGWEWVEGEGDAE